MITTIVVLSILLLLSIFAIVNLLRKIENIDDELSDINLFMDDMLNDLQTAQKQMKDVDSTGAFQSDDSTGTVFRELNNIINSISEKYDIQEGTRE